MRYSFQSMTAVLCMAVAASVPCAAQNRASDVMQAWGKGVMMPFAWDDTGTDFSSVMWGIDTAWQWEWWHRRTVNHMREYAEIGRLCMNAIRTSGTYTSLPDSVTDFLDMELKWLSDARGVRSFFILGGVSGGWSGSAATYANDLALAAQYIIDKGYTVVGITPFNEPDWQGPWSTEPLNSVAQALAGNAIVKAGNIHIVGPSCLNNDNSLSWWAGISGNYTMGNTHQLGGSAGNFINFYQTVSNAGKPSAGDEMHTANDALMGMQYGMDYGIWWSDWQASGYTQAETGRAAKSGNRIAYSEDRTHFASAAIFKNNTDADFGEAIASSSERQGSATAFSYVSKDRIVYFDGQGPLYDYTVPINGGYSETVTEMSYGEDVPMTGVGGTFKIVNKASGRLLTKTSSGLVQAADDGKASQTWNVNRLPATQGGDRAYATVVLKGTGYYLDATAYGASNGSGVSVYQGGGNGNEIWHFRYAGDGYYILTNHQTGLSLEGSSDNTDATSTQVCMWERTGSDRQLWRLIPADGTWDATPPAVPARLRATAATGSITLTWEAVSDAYSYQVSRYNSRLAVWETIGRNIQDTTFVDNICSKSTQETYRVRALNSAWVKGEASAEVSATVSQDRALVGHWSFHNSLSDSTVNRLDAVTTGAALGTTASMPALTFDGSSGYAALPYNVGDLTDMTLAVWVYPTSGTAWQRIFDFGNGSDSYLFLTPSNGSVMRFAIKKSDGSEQTLDATQALPLNQWSHVAVTLGADGVSIYLNGQLNATSTAVTCRPSDVKPHLSYIGRSMYDADALFAGSVSDLRIYNYALSAAEEQTLYCQSQLALADSIREKPMNRDVLAAYDEACAAAQEAFEESASDIADKMAALTTAQTTAVASITAYEHALAALTAQEAMLDSTNFYSAEALETYGYETHVAAYETRTLTDDEANAIENPSDHSIGWHVPNATNSLLMDVWGGTLAGYGSNVLYVNTWSTESQGKNVSFQAPFLEYWTSDAGSITPTTLTATLTGVEPGTYAVRVKLRARVKNDGGSQPTGITVNLNGGTPVDATAGTLYTADDATWTLGRYVASGTVGDDGVLKFNVVIANDNNVSWLSMKDLMYSPLDSKYYIIDETSGNDSSSWVADMDHSVQTLNGIETAGNVDVLLKRQFVADAWNMLVLPFNLSNDSVRAVFGEDTRVAAFTKSVTEGDDSYTLYFDESQNDIQANVPVMMYCGSTSAGQTQWWFYHVDMVKAEADGIYACPEDDGSVKFIGTYTYPTTIQRNDFYFSSNKFNRSRGYSKARATSGYFTIVSSGTSQSSITSNISTATGIVEISSGDGASPQRRTVTETYNLSGQRVGSSYKGIVIVNGKKVIRR